MALILDHVPQPPLLEGIQDWPRSCSREEWFRITRAIVAGVIADMAEDPARWLVLGSSDTSGPSLLHADAATVPPTPASVTA